MVLSIWAGNCLFLLTRIAEGTKDVPKRQGNNQILMFHPALHGQNSWSKVNVRLRENCDILIALKEHQSKSDMIKHSKSFDGSLNDVDCMRMIGTSSNMFYKYKGEL